ncbi:MAG: T9SS type A sorting domain-containing protein [Crocinitomicaceae bacterium]|nr:T9SS type A sorting domain-containing protein [Crocinitomicaceae bacterium]
MKILLIALFIGFSSISTAQQSTGFCDSIIVDSLRFDPTMSNHISIQATNLNTNDYLPYPGFILFNNNGDTIAKENVNYFGIGPFPQTHGMEIINHPASLPMSGYIELYSWFYDSLRCTFPVTLTDSMASLMNHQNTLSLNAFPNPSNGVFTISGIKQNPNNYLLITDQKGKRVNARIKNGNEIDLSNQKSGIYFLALQQQGSVQRLKLIKL